MTEKKTIVALENPPRDFFQDQRTYAYFLNLVSKINEIIFLVNDSQTVLIGLRKIQDQLITAYKIVNDSLQKIMPYRGTTKYANEKDEKQSVSDEMYRRYLIEKDDALKKGEEAYNQFLEENEFFKYF